jgi:hypothetical protein
MFLSFEVVSVFLVAITMSMAVAHAPERPGKMRLGGKTTLPRVFCTGMRKHG